jgi:hypothetical protein
MSTYGNKLYGLNDIKITNLAGTVQADLPVSQQLTMRTRVKSGELSGDDRLVAVAAFIEAAEWQLNAGGIDLDALAIMVGNSVVVGGTSPNETSTLNLSGGDNLPYFKIYGKSLGEGDDDLHVKLYKCKITGNFEGTFQDGQFFVSNFSGIAVDDGVNGVVDVVQNETAAALPAS